MPRIFQGLLHHVEGRFAIVVSRHNDNITGKLLTGAVETLKKYGVAEEAIDIAWVPGAGKYRSSRNAWPMPDNTWRLFASGR